MKHMNTGPEIWAGIECTINRIGDVYHQQLEKTGHIKRLDDLDKFAELGIKTIRYPILWEQIAPGKLEDADWSWADERLNKLRTLDICPIVGFVHHGSGPIHTSLTDDEFPAKLAAYAAAFAQRYPWIKYYTPINEPLTTARFSGLYGHWYPHGRDNNTFATALVNQCKAIILSFQAIRARIPDAKLVQTEDLCKVYSTPLLSYQAAFENERRWLSLDLICGMVKMGHPMWDELLSYNISEEVLNWFLKNACLPEIIGINHYVTSNRFLDENVHQYPSHFHGGNSFHQYADVEAIRIPGIDPCSLYSLLKEVWERYELPIAITEVHLGGHREEQLRWLKECWDTAKRLRADNINIKAITIWSLLGSFDWNSLVTRNDNFYESGVFDVRNGSLRPTALSAIVRKLIRDKAFHMRILNKPGFWQREDRFFEHYQQHRQPALAADIESDALSPNYPVLIVESDNILSASFIACCKSRAIHYVTASLQQSDLSDGLNVREMTERYKPWCIINTMVYKHDDANDRQCELEDLAELCMENKVQLLAFVADPTAILANRVLGLMPDALIEKIENSLEGLNFQYELANRCIDLLIDKVSMSC
jgi:dTDP-4-dehydrorhamnose reductase